MVISMRFFFILNYFLNFATVPGWPALRCLWQYTATAWRQHHGSRISAYCCGVRSALGPASSSRLRGGFAGVCMEVYVRDCRIFYHLCTFHANVQHPTTRAAPFSSTRRTIVSPLLVQAMLCVMKAWETKQERGLVRRRKWKQLDIN